MSQIKENDVCPEFELILSPDSKNISDFRGTNIIIYFYPKDDTPGCTIEAKDFSELTPEFQKLNTKVIGISKDDLKKHAKFVDKYKLQHELASDIEGKICEIFGTWVEKSMYGKKYMGIERSTFFIDDKGIIRKIWRNVSAKNHAATVLDYLVSSRHG